MVARSGMDHSAVEGAVHEEGSSPFWIPDKEDFAVFVSSCEGELCPDDLCRSADATYQLCNIATPFQCVEGTSATKCSSDAMHFLIEEFGQCTQCCDARLCSTGASAESLSKPDNSLIDLMPLPGPKLPPIP
jgi:hypothetical protein